MTEIALVLIGTLLGGGAVFFLKTRIFAGEYRKVEAYQKQLEAKNREDLERSRKQSQLELKEEFANWKNEYSNRQNEKVNRLNATEKRLIQKEENLDKRYTNLDNKEKELKKKERDLELEEEEIAALKQQVNHLHEEQRLKLEKISGLTVQEAKDLIIKQYEGEARLESAQKLKQIEEELKEKSQQLAKEVISNAVQRIATEHVVSSSVTVIDLPSDEMKGRIIGREGRNIRALENATGVDFIVDDTPEAILVSSFDPIRREMAKQAIETLIADGRIHPARIEEIVDRIKGNFDTYLRKQGEAAVLELGIRDLNP
jgi:ribonuclease Y